MTDFIDIAPSSWRHDLYIAEIYRNRVIKRDRFELVAGGQVSHWGQVFSFDSPVDVEIEVSRVDEYVILNIAIFARVSTNCSRCLDMTGVAVKGKSRYLFSLHSCLKSTGEERNKPEGELGEEEVVLVSSWDEAVNLGELAWETLITTLPGAVLCSGDCMGLCQQCGASLNKVKCDCKKEAGDPRLEALKGLLDDEA